MKIGNVKLALAGGLLLSQAAFGLSFSKLIECDSGDTWVDIVTSPTGYEIGRQLVISNPEIVRYLVDEELMEANEKGEVLFTSKFIDYQSTLAKTGQLSRILLNTFTNKPQYLDVFMRYKQSSGKAYVKFDIYKPKTSRTGVMRDYRLGGWEFNDCRML